MTLHRKLGLCIGLTILLVPLAAQAAGNNVSLGVLSIHSTSIYKETDSKFKALPFASYSGEHFYLKGTEVGYNVLPKGSSRNVGIGLAYNFATFAPNDSDNKNIQKLDSRDDSIMAIVHAKLGFLSAKLAQDVSDTHNGYYAEIGAGYPIQLQKLRITPSISYRYMDSKMSDYQFGVSSAESVRTGNILAAYNAPSTTVTRFSINSLYPLSQSVLLNVSFTYLKYDNSVLDSPVVEKDHKNIVMAGIIYKF